jgi:hypothetical protein
VSLEFSYLGSVRCRWLTGATACVVLPRFWDQHQEPGD